MTQFGRAMKELDIEIICANTPQAKGRVERANQTLQDRLVKELRLRGISSMDAANEYASEFMTDLNNRFAAQPRSSHDAHRQLLPSEDLDLIFTKRDLRILSKNQICLICIHECLITTGNRYQSSIILIISEAQG